MDIETIVMSSLAFVFMGVITMLIKSVWRRYILLEAEVKQLRADIHQKATHADMLNTVDRIQSRLNHIENLILDLSKK